MSCLLIMFIVVLLLIVLIDAYCKYKVKISHRLLKQWIDRNEWEEKVINCGNKWVKKMPIVRLNDNERLIILDIIKKRYKHSSLQGWQYASLIDGICCYNKSLIINNNFQKYINKIKEIDEGYLLYVLWQNKLVQYSNLEDSLSQFFNVLRERIRTNGTIEYREGFKNICLSDTIAFACPLLIKYGEYIGEVKYIDLAMKQIKMHRKYGYIGEYGLYSHAYDSIKKCTCESIGWGRGTGWFLLGVLDSYETISQGENKEYLKQLLVEGANNILKYQMDDGGWCSELVSQWNYDSSVTAMFGYFLYKLFILEKNVKYKKSADLALKKLMSMTRFDGAIEYCEGACHGVGKYSKLYTISPFTQGMLIKLLSVEKEVFINEQ